MGIVIALDQGTSSCRALAFDEQRQIIALAQQEFNQHFPKPGWVEHDAEEIWRTQLHVTTQVLQDANVQGKEIAALGITNQRETIVIWEKATGKPIAPAIVWQDKRTAEYCAQLKAQPGVEEMVRQKTGLVLDPYFSASKIAWLLDNVPTARERAEAGALLCGTIDSWLVYNLTLGNTHVTDLSNASRTLLCNIHTGKWDDALLELFDIPRALLPDITASSGVIAHTDEAVFGTNIPIASMIGDQQAALFGQGCHAPGMAKNTYGTGCFLLMHTGDTPVASQYGLLSTVAWKIGGEVSYALEGAVFVAGSAIQWLRDGMQWLDKAPDSEFFARKVPHAEGVIMVPAFAGLGAPYWCAEAKGAMFGLTRKTTKDHIIRATLDALAYQTKDVLDAMEQDAKQQLRALHVDGGASENSLLMQFQADILGMEVRRANQAEATAWGAAWLAGLAVGLYDNTTGSTDNYTHFTPKMQPELQQKLYSQWRTAVDAVIGMGE